MGGNGRLQTLSQMEPGKRYHVTVRAVTGANNILEAPTDGVIPDVSPPSLNITMIQRVVTPDKVQGPMYTQTMKPFSATWEVEETESLVLGTTLALGSYPWGEDVLEPINSTAFTTVPNGLLNPSVTDGTAVITLLQAENNVCIYRYPNFLYALRYK